MKDGVGNANSQEGQLMAMMKMVVAQAQASDKLFLETGVEEDQLNKSIQALNL